MNGSLPFKIQIIANGNLELILTSRRSKIARSYLHPLNREEAERFANTLEAALASGAYTDLDCCPSVESRSHAKTGCACSMAAGSSTRNACARL